MKSKITPTIAKILAEKVRQKLNDAKVEEKAYQEKKAIDLKMFVSIVHGANINLVVVLAMDWH